MNNTISDFETGEHNIHPVVYAFVSVFIPFVISGTAFLVFYIMKVHNDFCHYAGTTLKRVEIIDVQQAPQEDKGTVQKNETPIAENYPTRKEIMNALRKRAKNGENKMKYVMRCDSPWWFDNSFNTMCCTAKSDYQALAKFIKAVNKRKLRWKDKGESDKKYVDLVTYPLNFPQPEGTDADEYVDFLIEVYGLGDMSCDCCFYILKEDIE